MIAEVDQIVRDREDTLETPGPVICQVFRAFKGLDHLRPAWDKAVQESGGSVYMTYDWIRVWWEFYGGSAELRLFVFCVGEVVVAVLPMYIDTLGWGPLRFRVARLVGANIPPKVFDPPVRERWAAPVFKCFLDRLFGDERCDLLSFGPFSELQKSGAELAVSCELRAGFPLRCSDAVTGVHTVFWLPPSMEEYFASLSKNENKNRRKYELRLLKKEYEVQEDTVSDAELVGAELEEFARQHAAQWAAQGKSGHFGAWPRGLEYNRALVRAQAQQGRVRFMRILANGKVISRQYAFAWGKSCVWELPARSVGDPWDRFSLGPTGIVRMIHAAIQEGRTRLEGGMAHYEYKLRLGAKEYPVHTVRILAPGLAVRLRAAYWQAFRGLVKLLYHKLWYRRIIPHLPEQFRRPQLWIWLRLDF